MLLLKKYELFERFAIAIAIELALFAFGFVLIYIPILLASFYKPNIDYNMLTALGTLLAIIVLGPVYCYYINKHRKDKENSNYIFPMVISTIIYIAILIVISIFL